MLIVGLQEVKRLDYGEVDIDLPSNNYKLIWNGNKNKRTEGVGVIVKKYSLIKLIDVEPISSRLPVVKTLIHNLNIKFVVAYAPTEEGSSELKNKFYYQLNLCCTVAKREKLVVLGDFNATTSLHKSHCSFNGTKSNYPPISELTTMANG